jgi:hypothetical protein
MGVLDGRRRAAHFRDDQTPAGAIQRRPDDGRPPGEQPDPAS